MPKFGFARGGLPPPQGATYHAWWILVSTIVMGVGIGVLAQPQLIVRFMTVNSKQALNRAVAAGGFFILCMTGVAFTVGALSNLSIVIRVVLLARRYRTHVYLKHACTVQMAA